MDNFIGTFRGKKVNIIDDEEELTISNALSQYITELEEEIKRQRNRELNNLFQELNLRRTPTCLFRWRYYDLR